MARPKRLVPAYTEHASGLARIHWNGRDIYLGVYNSPESLAEYARIVAEITAQPAAPVPKYSRESPGPTVDAVLLAFMRWALTHYRRPDGTNTNQVVEYKYTLQPLRALYGHTVAADFGPLALKAVRAEMVKLDWCRTQINSRIGKIKRVFKWASSEQLVPVAVYSALATVQGLQVGRSSARESDPVEPVPLAHVEATLPFLNDQVAGIVRFQLFTGCRPGEACYLRRSDIDATGDVWLYRPDMHKTAHHGKHRLIAIGPKAQDLLKALPVTERSDFVFSPKRARSAERTAGARRPGERYTAHALAVAITRAARKADVRAWAPNQLRHTFATEVRKRFGLEAAQVALGHSNARVTEIYGERDEALALRVAREIG